MKKFISILMGVTLTVGIVGFAGCGEEPEASDPVHGFEGTFSEESFESEQDAVQALEGEFGGATFSIDVKKYSHESKISKKTIKNLNKDKLGEDDKVVSGKNVKVTYTSTADNTSSTAATAEEESFFSAKVFETKEDGNKRFRYYIDRADYDGMISKSFFLSLTTAEPGDNFTYTTSTSMTIEMMGERETESESMTIKCDGDRAIVQVGDEVAYLEREDGELKAWEKTESGYKKITDLNFSGVNLRDYFEEGVAEEKFEEFDQSCFMPSEKGIVLSEGGKSVLMQELEKDIQSDMEGYSGMFSFDGSLSFDIETKDGVPMKFTIKIDVSANILIFTLHEKVEGTAEFTDVGTTVVERPLFEEFLPEE